MPRTLRDRVVDRFWARHSNPKSGWTRVPGGAVLAERWWLRQDNRTVGLGYPNVCNTVAATGFLLALVAAWRRRPAGMAVGTALSVGLKLWWLRELVERYDERG